MTEFGDRTDHFGVFDLPRELEIDVDELERTFFAKSRERHPDRFVGQGAEALSEAQKGAARLNDAYRTLKDPVRRAEHLLALEGVDRPQGEAKCPPDLLAEVFDLREQISEGPSEELRIRVERLLAEADGRLAGLFGRHDAAPRPDRPALLVEIRGALDRRQFLLSLTREVEKALGSP